MSRSTLFRYTLQVFPNANMAIPRESVVPSKLMIVMVNTDPKNPAELGAPKSVYDFMKDAHETGGKFRVCTPALDLWGEDLIHEIEETVGGTYVISQAMDDDVVTFTY